MEENVTEKYKIGGDVKRQELTGKVIQKYPNVVKIPFLKKRKTLIQKLMFWKKNLSIEPYSFKQPILFLMRNSGYIDVIEGVKAGGVFVLKDKDTGKEKGILLKQNKLFSLNIDEYPRCWIAHENSMAPYPVDVLQDSSDLVDIVRRIETTKGLLKDEAKVINAKMMFWLAILGMGGLILYFAMKNGWLTGLF